MRNIEETERAKRPSGRAREGDEGDAAARGAHDGRATGGVVDDRLRLDRKMFASSFGKGGGPRGDASSRARWRERDDERRETTNGGAGGGGGGRGAAAEVASRRPRVQAVDEQREETGAAVIERVERAVVSS